MFRHIFPIISVIFSGSLPFLAVADSRHGDTPRGDTVPFMLVVQHAGGPRCAGALVSMRSAVSTASCVTLHNGPITVMAGPFLTGVGTLNEAVRRVTSVVIPWGYVATTDFAGAVNDVAVLRLESPFGASKLVKPILIGKDYMEYEKEGKLCNLVRALPAPVMRQRREEMNTLVYLDSTFRTTPIYRNIDFTVSTSDDSIEFFSEPNMSSAITVNVTTQEITLTTLENTFVTVNLNTQSITSTETFGNTTETQLINFDNPNWLENESKINTNNTIETVNVKNWSVRMPREATESSTGETSNRSSESRPIVIPEVIKEDELDDNGEVRNKTVLNKRTSKEKSEEPTSSIIIFKIYDVRTLNMDQCREDNRQVGNHHWTALSGQIMCTHGANFCQTDWGTGLVCDGKLSALLSRVAHPTGQPIGAGCGTTHTLQSLGRWKRFLGCAHDAGNCDILPCSKFCQEKRLRLDKIYSPRIRIDNSRQQTSRSNQVQSKNDNEHSDIEEDLDNEQVKQKPSESDDSDISGDSDVSDNEQMKQQPIDVPEPVVREQLRENYTTKQQTKQSKTSPRPTRTKSQDMISVRSSLSSSISKSTAERTSRAVDGDNIFEFEPYRADFKPGEYGDNVIEYRDGSEDEFVVGGNSTTQTESANKETPTQTPVTNIFTDDKESSSVENTIPLLGNTTVYNLMPKLKSIDRYPYDLQRSNSKATIQRFSLFELIVFFAVHLTW